jgi:hypothetical protein
VRSAARSIKEKERAGGIPLHRPRNNPASVRFHSLLFAALKMAREGFEPSGSLVLSESGLPVAWRAFFQFRGLESNQRPPRSERGVTTSSNCPGIELTPNFQRGYVIPLDRTFSMRSSSFALIVSILLTDLLTEGRCGSDEFRGVKQKARWSSTPGHGTP